MTSLKASRDKLLFEIDRLSVDLDFATSENQVLSKQKEEQENLSEYWKQQSKERLRQIERLKEMLDESAEVGHSCRKYGSFV